MDIFLSIVAIICGLVGLLGVIVPVLPGTLLSYAGLLCVYFTDTSTVTNNQLIFWGLLSVAVILLDYILPGYFSKKFGGSRYGIIGANVGVIIGLFFSLPGIILGPFFGAFIGELINDDKSMGRALQVAFGSLMSFLVGSGMKLVIGGFLMYYILCDTINIIKDIF
jgi:uncharacterized protein YqgC (DUF456 family)